jgi:hypothetical protein
MVLRALSPKLRVVVEALALERPPLPVAALHRQICKIAGERRENIPTCKAVYRIVRELPKDLVTLAHEGTTLAISEAACQFGSCAKWKTTCASTSRKTFP